MKLSDLVNLKNQLDATPVLPIRSQTMHELNKVLHLANINIIESTIEADYRAINQAFSNLETSVAQIRSSIQAQISIAEKPWFSKSYELYEGELNSLAKDILPLRTVTDPNYELFKSRLKRYTDWHHSAIIIRPGTESFVEDLVAFDPLYLIDLNYDYLEPSLSKFNEQYQNRLRTYTINEDLDTEILEKLPNGQFGLCFAYNYFNFRPFEVLKKYLAEIYTKLKPGGNFIMTFNDCDRSSAVKLVEQYYSCYTPGYLVCELVQTMGFEIVYSFNDDGPTTWLELKKPGTLTSIKGGQSLGKIVQK